MAGEVQPIGDLPVHIPLTSEYLLAWGSGRDTFRTRVSEFLTIIPSITDHGDLLGLSDDDHPQYFDQTRGDARYARTTDSRFHTHANLATLGKITEAAGLPLWNGAAWPGASGGGGVTDHGALTGLSDDDHPQYLNQARGDARYGLLTDAHTHANKAALDKITESGDMPFWDGAPWPSITSSAVWEYQFSTTTTAPPTGSQIRFNNPTQTLATRVYVTKITSSGADVSLGLFGAPEGATIYVQDWDDSTKFIRFTNLAAPVDHGTWVEYIVSLVDAGDPLIAQKVGFAIRSKDLEAGPISHSSLLGLDQDDHPQYFTEERGDLRYAAFGSGVTDHGALTGLADDDHTQYLTQARGDARYALLSDSRFHAHTNLTTLNKITESAGLPLWNGAAWPGGGGGVTAHSALTGLSADDHTQYYNQARGDARYLQSSVAATTYATLTFVSDTYLTQSDAMGTYLMQADATNMYAPKSEVQIYATPGSFVWDKPYGAVSVFVEAWGGGGGGGSGRKGAGTTARTGGGGGGAGGYSNSWFRASDLASGETVVVGAGGTGPAAVTASDTNGANGGAAGNSSFSTVLYARGGFGGTGGSATAAAGGNVGQGSIFTPGASGTSNPTSGGTAGNGAIHTGGGGGAGAAIQATDAILAATVGGKGFSEKTAAFAVSGGGGNFGGNQTAGSSGTKGDGGGGGGAAGAVAGQNAGKGGDGAQPAGGGGGGGAGINTFGNSGGGGIGGAGMVIVTTYF